MKTDQAPTLYHLGARAALFFVILFGCVSLFADMTYEGARSITGPFLAVLGASSVAVGIVAGLGELIGNVFRLLSGFIADRTRRYWLLAIVGYAINLVAVPLLALAGNWVMASTLIVLERFGKAIRKPSTDTMLSFARTPAWNAGVPSIGATTSMNPSRRLVISMPSPWNSPRVSTCISR